MSVASMKGESYYATFIDDFSRKTWIYSMKTKDEVLQSLMTFQSSGRDHDRKEDQGIEDR
jgi:hypothetical protein